MQTQEAMKYFVLYKIEMSALVRWHAAVVTHRYRPSPRFARRPCRVILRPCMSIVTLVLVLVLVLSMTAAFFLASMFVTIVVVSIATLVVTPSLVAPALVIIDAIDPDEINRLATGVVTPAVLGPVLRMARWDMQVQRRLLDYNGRTLNDHGLRVNQRRRRRIADLNATIHTGTQSAFDGGIDVGLGRMRGRCP